MEIVFVSCFGFLSEFTKLTFTFLLLLLDKQVTLGLKTFLTIINILSSGFGLLQSELSLFTFLTE
jgi:hypothetical protein